MSICRPTSIKALEKQRTPKLRAYNEYKWTIFYAYNKQYLEKVRIKPSSLYIQGIEDKKFWNGPNTENIA